MPATKVQLIFSGNELRYKRVIEEQSVVPFSLTLHPVKMNKVD